jgi:hypothetical protein
MSIDPAILRAMADAGASMEVILAAVEAAHAKANEKLDEKRRKDAERQRKSRANREQSQDVTVTPRDNTDITDISSSPLDGPLSFPQTPNLSPLNPPTTSIDNGGATADVLPFPKAKSRKADRSNRKTTLPENFTLTAERLAFARKEGLTDETARREFAKFAASAEAHGRKYVSWDGAWQNWVRTSVDGFGKSSRPSPSGHGAPSGGRFGAMQRALARVSNADPLPE